MPKTKKERLKEMFPALCRANDPAPVCGFRPSFFYVQLDFSLLIHLQASLGLLWLKMDLRMTQMSFVNLKKLGHCKENFNSPLPVNHNE